MKIIKRNLFIILLFVSGCTALKSDSPPDSLPDINKLVSSNPAVTSGSWSMDGLPADWSEDEDRRVWSVYNDIISHGKEVIPSLISKLDCTEFSTIRRYYFRYYPLSVNQMCLNAVEEIFDPIGIMYKFRDNADGEVILGENYFWHHFETKSKAERWWEEYQLMTTEEIKYMVRDWYIERELSFGFKDEEQKESILGNISSRFTGDFGIKQSIGPAKKDIYLTIEEMWEDANEN